MTAHPATVLITHDGPVTIIAINRPERKNAVDGATGRARPSTLKVSLGFRDGFIGEGQISYAGTGALDRANLAVQIVRERLALAGIVAEDLRYDLIGVNAVHGTAWTACTTSASTSTSSIATTAGR